MPEAANSGAGIYGLRSRSQEGKNMGAAFKSDRYSASFASDPEHMAALVMQYGPASDAEALKLLRASFPNCPLSARVAALDYLMRRRPRGFGVSYSPK
jgi:hypothetical protein